MANSNRVRTGNNSYESLSPSALACLRYRRKKTAWLVLPIDQCDITFQIRRNVNYFKTLLYMNETQTPKLFYQGILRD